jgi:putative ABC transport system permease protein
MFLQVIRMALETVRSNKMRSFLTILGIVIGITTVVAIASIIQGLNGWFASQVSSLGSNIVTVTRLPQFANRFPTDEEKQRKELTLEDTAYLQQEAQNVEVVTAILPLNPFQFPNPNIRSGRVHANGVRVYGVEPDYINVYVSHVRSGRFLSDGDVYHRSSVIVLGATVAENMFPGTDPVGKQVYFENDAYDVVGVLEKRGSIFGLDRDNFVWIPVTTMLKLHPESKYDLIIAMTANSQLAMPLVMDQVTEILRRRRHDGYNKPNSFDVGSQNQFIDFYNALTGGAYLVVLVIGSIGLMVGGIGVMNIMLVSVTERTREIGVRKAIGARKRHILLQFLLEAMVLTGIGGVVGIIVGTIISMLINYLSPVPSALPVMWIMIAFTVSVSVGLFFGIYPAARAAQLDPIEALRYE